MCPSSPEDGKAALRRRGGVRSSDGELNDRQLGRQRRGDNVSADDVSADDVFADENVNTLDVFSTAPVDNGGVAVIVLGYTKSIICCGEMGWAVEGVSG